MKIEKFTDLEVWKESHKLTLLVYQLTAKFPKEEVYALVSQLRRASVSVESCIAEGFCRYHYKDRLTFYFDARGSIGEIQSQLITAKDLGYIEVGEYESASSQTEKAGVILGGLIRSTMELIHKQKST